MKIDFQPKLFEGLRHYSREKFIADLMAGIIVGIVALPLAIAFGIASGVTPEKGLITAIVGGFIVSALGGSSVQIGGPTGAFIVIVFGIIQGYGLEGLAIATAMAGALLSINSPQTVFLNGRSTSNISTQSTPYRFSSAWEVSLSLPSCPKYPVKFRDRWLLSSS